MPQYEPIALSITARVLTPFYYHGLYARDGSATHPNVITDTALVFALQATLLPHPVPVLRAKPDYLADLRQIPWRASLLMSPGNFMLPPVRHTIDVAKEGGYHENMQKNMGSGNFKNTFFVHEVAVDASYTGLLYGPDPFKISGTKHLIVRVGVAKQGMLEITRCESKKLKKVQLNTATAQLFGRNHIPEAYRILDTIRVSEPVAKEEAEIELQHW
jgi:hypothetical protein